MKVTFFHRKPRPDENFSIEAYFQDIRRHLSSEVQYKVAESSYYSQGIWHRVYNVIEAAFRQGDINHITGDVHFLALGLEKKKTILTIHDCGFMQHPHPLARWMLLWFWLRLPVMRSRSITAVSQATKDDIIRYTGCNPDKVRVIPTTVQASYRPSPQAFNADCPRILIIGTAPNKNLERMLPALEGIRCNVSIVGRLSEEQKELLLKYQIDYENKCRITDEAMRQEYRACDLLLFASTLEGFGMPILEAQWVERPVITSNCSSMPEVAGKGACLVDPYDVQRIRAGILKVIQDADYRELLTKEGRKNRLRFQPEVVARQYEALYREIMNAKL